MHGPAGRAGLGDARLPGIEQFQRRLNGVAVGALGGGRQFGTALPGGFDGGLQVKMWLGAHVLIPVTVRMRRTMRVRMPRCQRVALVNKRVNIQLTFPIMQGVMAASSPPGQNRLAPSPAAGWLAVAAMLADLAFETDTRGPSPPSARARCSARRRRSARHRPCRTARRPGCVSTGAGTAPRSSPRSATKASPGTAICVSPSPVRRASRLFRLSLAPRSPAARSPAFTASFSTWKPWNSRSPPASSPAAPRLDAETGLCSAATFTQELVRRFDRLDVEELPGWLLYLGFCQTALRRAASRGAAGKLAQGIVRPTDLLGRIDETTLALWCDGMDHLTGGERAAQFCTNCPLFCRRRRASPSASHRAGPAAAKTRRPSSNHAVAAMRTAARRPAVDGPAGTWHVWQPTP